MTRWTRFIIVLLFGIGIGLVYAWVINPIEYVDTSPNRLRQDYKTDYVLMVAEAYQAEEDLEIARARLALLGDETPQQSVRNAVLFASSLEGYPVRDISVLRALSQDLGSQNPTIEAPSP